MLTVACFSAGVSSAVAVKLCPEVDVVLYTHIDDQHCDTLRFVEDCAAWFGKPVERLQSPLKCVENALLAAGGRGYVNGPGGAPCTRLLKRRVRKAWEREQSEPIRYVWGLDATEKHRVERVVDAMPDQEHLFPLVAERIDKPEAHKILRASGIRRPALYDMGYHNNNCVGCVKGGGGLLEQSPAGLSRSVCSTCRRGTPHRGYLREGRVPRRVGSKQGQARRADRGRLRAIL